MNYNIYMQTIDYTSSFKTWKSKQVEYRKKHQNTPKDLESIRSYCIEWAEVHLGNDFQFRQYQLEHIIHILNNILNKPIKISAIEAPTGSGKSIIAMIVCGVAWEYYGLTSYILVSDLGLYNQYIDDFNKYQLDWGHIKGSQNSYCSEDGMMISMAKCKLHKIGYEVLMSPDKAIEAGYKCANSCSVIQNRKRAIQSPITLMTYSMYLCQLNDVAPLFLARDGQPPFEKRDIVISDECHKIPSIIQNWESPELNYVSDSQNLQALLDYGHDHGILPIDMESIKDFQDFHRNMYLEQDSNKVWEIYQNYYNAINKLHSFDEKYNSSFAKLKGEYDKDDKKAMYALNWLWNQWNLVEAMYLAIKEIGSQYLVKNAEDDLEFASKDAWKKYRFNCAMEDYLVYRFFHKVSDKEVLLSATIGDSMIFQHDIGLNWLKGGSFIYDFLRIPSTFDFNNSPIYVLSTYKMSNRYKDRNFPYVAELVNKILQRHQGQRGIIHTGSYTNMNKLYNLVNPTNQYRLITYQGAREKDDALIKYQRVNNSIIVGPTLIEGINLPGDLCRFMIIIKVPYPSLGDKLVKTKMDLVPGWYQAETMKQIEQAVGRGVRYNGDYCITYILDGCFLDLYYTRGHNFSPEFKQRIKIVGT